MRMLGASEARPPPRANGFGFLRLLFASLVIVSHSVEMVDGNQVREPLHMLTGTLSLGRLAVDGFFLISGYLITASFISDPRGYLWKRILRIYPAFLVCSLLCLFVVAPLAGGTGLSPGEALHALVKLLTLKAPVVPGIFAGTHYAALDGSMWTISYEFRCYLLAALLGLLGVYRRPALLVGATGTMLALSLLPAIPIPRIVEATLGETRETFSLSGTFLLGACFRLLSVRLNGRGAAAAGAALLMATVPAALVGWPLMGPVAELLLVTLGGYVMFWVALQVKSAALRKVNAKDDISYGVYLYAWPIGALTIWWWNEVSPLVLMAITLAGASAFGWISWKFIERPAMRLRPRPADPRPVGARLEPLARS